MFSFFRARKLTAMTLFSLSCAFLRAQETVNYASVSGRIIDASGAPIEGAQVSARKIDTNITSKTHSASDGRFRFSYLSVGRYEIGVQQQGFTDWKGSVDLTIGAAFDVPVSLSVGVAATSILVTGETPLIETARTQVAGTISREEVDNLPLNGRNYLDLALVVPGVSQTNTASTQLFAETSAVPGQGFSIGSQRNFSNNFIVDGLSANDDAAGLTGTFYGLDVVREFQVVTSGGQAEFGRALGGYVSMVTKSGGNALHGDIYGYFRNQRLNADNALTNRKLPLTQAQYGASVAGPIIPDRTFYFANFEQRDLNQSGLMTIAPANVNFINSRLASDGYKGPGITTGFYSNPVHNHNLLAKIDHQFSERDQFSVRYSLYEVNSANSSGVGGLSAISAGAALKDSDHTVAFSNVLTISPRTVNETRGQFTHSNLDAAANDSFGPAVSIAGIATFGTLSSSPTGRLDKLYEIADNLSHQAGAHALRMGVDFLYNNLRITFPQSINGSYAFPSLASFAQGIYSNSGFTQSFGNPLVFQTNPNVGFYAQDEWSIGPRLTVNFGARYDLEFLKSISTDTGNVSPRAGFAWSPRASRRTIIRGSFGVFYDRIPLRPLANALLSSGNTTDISPLTFTTVSVSPAQAGAPQFPNVLSTVPANVLVNFTTMDRGIQNPYSEQGSLEIEQQLGNRSTFSISYQHLRGRHLIVSVNQNTPTCVASGTNNGCRPNATYGNNKQYQAAADSQYDGVSLSFIQRPVRWGSFRTSYTYSKALDDVGEFFFSAPIDNFNIRRDWGRSDDDQRHRVAFDFTAHSSMRPASTTWQHWSRGFQLSGILQYYSPLPFNVTTGANTVQGTTARPLLGGSFIGRNTASGFDGFTLNGRLSREFAMGERWKLQAMAEGFNLLNRRNNLIPNGTFGGGVYPSNPLPTFGTPTAVADPRTLQLALRFNR